MRLRKAFGCRLFKRTGGDLALERKMLTSAKPAYAPRCLGLDREQMRRACLALNLGLHRRPPASMAAGRSLAAWKPPIWS